MEITSDFIETPELGRLHAVRFEPDAKNSESTVIVPNSLNGRILTPDGFGLPYHLAAQGRDTLYIEFPGSGHSPLPEDKTLRRDYIRHGTIALGDAVQEALAGQQNFDGLNLDDVSLGGFSLGAVRAATLLPGFGTRATRFFSIEAAGYGSNPTARNILRYFKHTRGAEAGLAALDESVDGYFADSADQLAGFQDWYGEYLKPRRVGPGEQAIESLGIYDSMTGIISSKVFQQMKLTAETGQNFDVRAGFAEQTYALDQKTVTQTNENLDAMDDLLWESAAPVSYGFVQGGWMGKWHQQAVSPQRVTRLLDAPADGMQLRLQHVYM